MAIGGLIGGAVDPTKINGPHIGQGQSQTASPGVPIAWVQGTAKVAGTLAVVGSRREVKIQDSGKGGPIVSHFEARQDFMIVVCESSELRETSISSILVVEQDGKIVYDMRPTSKITEASMKWKANVDFLFGGEDQLPHPTLEAISGVGSTPAYRGVCIAVFKDFNVTAAGDRIPQFLFTVSSDTTDSTIDYVLEDFIPGSIGSGTAGFGGQYSTRVADADSSQFEVGGYRYRYDFVAQTGSPVIGDFIIPPNSDLNWAFSRMVLTTYSEGLADQDQYHFSRAEIPAVITKQLGRDDSGYNIWDSFWHYFYGPPTPDDINTWFTSNSMSAPETEPGNGIQTDTLYVSTNDLSPMGGLTQLVLQYPGTFDALGLPLTATFAKTGNRDLVRYSGMYWLDRDTDIVWRPSWAAPYYTQPQSTPNSVLLDDIVRKICVRGGLQESDLDLTALVATPIDVAGYPIAAQCTADQALAPLLQAYFAFATECDGKLLFKFYGEDALQTVSRDDLVLNDATDGAISETRRNQATEFPLKVVAAFIDPDQNYDTNTVTAERLAQTVIAIGETDIQIPVAMDANQAAQAADKALKIAYATLEGTQDYSVPYATSNADYLTVCAGEPVLMDGKRWVVDDVTLSNGSIKFETRYDRQSAYTSDVQAVKPNPPSTPTSSYSGPTLLLPMNLPSLRPQDTYGIYLAAQGVLDSWRGCTVQISYDGKASWQNALIISTASIMGTLAEDEDGTGSTIVDIGPEDALESVTDAQLDANANAYAVVDADGVAEIRQFATAALETSGADTGDWLLSAQRTGLLGTTHKDYSAGDRFTMLGSVYFLPIDTAFAGKPLYLRGVGFGEVAEDAMVVSITFEAFSLRDFAIYGRITEDGSARIDTENNWRTLSL